MSLAVIGTIGQSKFFKGAHNLPVRLFFQVTGGFWAGYGQVMDRLQAGYGQVTGQSQAGHGPYRQVTITPI